MTSAQLTGEHGALESPAGAKLGKAPVASRAFGRRWPRLVVRFVGLLYLALLLALPVGLIFVRTFANGLQPVISVLQSPDFQHAFWLTITLTAIAVPINTVFGVITAITLVRHRFPGRGLLNAVIDLPFACHRSLSALRWSSFTDRTDCSATGSSRPASRSSSPCRAWSWPRSSFRCRSSCAR